MTLVCDGARWITIDLGQVGLSNELINWREVEFEVLVGG